MRRDRCEAVSGGMRETGHSVGTVCVPEPELFRGIELGAGIQQLVLSMMLDC